MRLLPTAVLAAVLCVPATPADAAPGVFTGTMHIDCFGCGTAHATATLDFLPGGPADGRFVVQAAFSACSAAWNFSGLIAGGRNAQVNVTVVLGEMVISGVGDFTMGGGTATIVSPVGNPCGLPVEMSLAGWVV